MSNEHVLMYILKEYTKSKIVVHTDLKITPLISIFPFARSVCVAIGRRSVQAPVSPTGSANYFVLEVHDPTATSDRSNVPTNHGTTSKPHN